MGMNRKQRRAAKGGGTALDFASSRRALADLFNVAAAHHQSGALAEAERGYQQVTASFPDHAEAHSRLGTVMMGQGRIGEAIPHLERAVALKPDQFEAWGSLTQAYSWSGRREAAVEAATRALELRETPQTRTMFAQCIAFARFRANNGRFRRLLSRALSEAWIRPRELIQACISLVKHNRVVNDGIARVTAAWPERIPAGELFSPMELTDLSRDELLCWMLECDPITDVACERLLTNLRHNMLTIATATDTPDAGLLPFYCNVARQCFINEYIYSMTESETDRAQSLRAMLEDALSTGEQCPALWPIVVGAYFPLHMLSNAQALLNRPWPECVKALLIKQVQEPAQERRIATAIPALTSIDDAVSRAVRQQYEENPYPRWVRAGPPAQPAILMNTDSDRILDALIAGCGTGLSTIEFARQSPRARILAIDLSLPSLSYAKRMAEEFGLRNVTFAQADILRIGSLEQKFDFIDASGVLHHLADPWEGWRILLSLVRPGGFMQIGLYSEQARRNFVAARSLIAERGYRPTPEDIRRFREEVMSTDDPLLKSICNGADFFTISECRDLLFHVQEHRTTLPRIKSFLEANDLQFCGFFLDALTHHTFVTRFPQPAAMNDLDRWHAYEMEVPATFAGMYQFAVRKRQTG